ncbi:MAG TPA: TetR/AcrR family transcriptional regulator [Solirubrobacteraceae bacterium]|jgi:AcrR family transcriptional regulator|nr:TetR/AcrR family transcriptional regulator [Solirubrobacteraceae bacterium]
MSDTRERIVQASADLLRRQGYAATGVKQIVTAAQAPFGSIYHFFPRGKEQLGAEAIRRSGRLYELLIPAVFDPAPDIVSAVRAFFAGAAEHLRETDYADACPIATVALEVSSTSEPMREACADVFESWIAAGTPRFTAAGLSEPAARELVIAMIAALEGAFVLARATRSTEPLAVAGELTATATERALNERDEAGARAASAPHRRDLQNAPNQDLAG